MTALQAVCLEIILVCFLFPVWRIANSLQALVEIRTNETKNSTPEAAA